MTLLKRATQLLSAAVLIAGLSSSVFAQAKDNNQDADRQKNESTITGCLTKDASGYTLADEKTGTKMTVTGPEDLEKHSANHKVSLTGMAKTDNSGKSVFEVTNIRHIAADCKAPSQQ
jgi:hypothetical protein